jgi:plasmid stabilization system protein ParE
MTPRVVFRPEAAAELREARRWYEEQVPGLGRAFIAELETTLAFARVHPELYRGVTADGRVRRALLHRFPYSLTYEILEGGDLVVLACRHVRQDEVNLQARRPDV